VSLKPSIHYCVPASGVSKRAAHEYQEFIDIKRLTQPAYTVVCYPGMRGESSSIANYKSISKAIARAISHGAPIVAIAHNFTAEALELLLSHGAVVFRQRDDHWTDSSLASLREKR
jgi:hypothetical protein